MSAGSSTHADPRAIADTEAIWQAIARVEAQQELISWRIGGVYLWPLLRDRMFRELAEASGLVERRIEGARASAGAERNRAWQAAWPAVPQLRSDVLVIPFLRRDSTGRDQFTAGFNADSLATVGLTVSTMGSGPIDAAASDAPGTPPLLEDIEAFVRKRYALAAKIRVALALRPWHFAKYQRVFAALERELGAISQRYAKFPKWLLADFVAQRMGYRDLFAAAGTRAIVYPNAWRRGLIAGAQAAGALVAEPQHGAISNRHPLLSWPAGVNAAYQPDLFLAWGEYWATACGLPVNLRTAVVGAPESFERVRAQMAARDAGSKRILIASQVHQTEAIARWALAAATAAPEVEFLFKPHPQEDAGRIANLLSAAPGNLRIATADQPLLPLIAQNSALVGVYSTALFEAAALGLGVGVLKLAGWQHAAALLERGDAVELPIAPTAADLAHLLAATPRADSADYYYAKPSSPADLAGLLAKALRSA